MAWPPNGCVYGCRPQISNQSIFSTFLIATGMRETTIRPRDATPGEGGRVRKMQLQQLRWSGNKTMMRAVGGCSSVVPKFLTFPGANDFEAVLSEQPRGVLKCAEVCCSAVLGRAGHNPGPAPADFGKPRSPSQASKQREQVSSPRRAAYWRGGFRHGDTSWTNSSFLPSSQVQRPPGTLHLAPYTLHPAASYMRCGTSTSTSLPSSNDFSLVVPFFFLCTTLLHYCTTALLHYCTTAPFEASILPSLASFSSPSPSLSRIPLSLKFSSNQARHPTLVGGDKNPAWFPGAVYSRKKKKQKQKQNAAKPPFQ